MVFMTLAKKILWISTISIFVAAAAWLISSMNKSVPTQGDWQKALSVLSTAEIKGDLVTVRNVRNFRYEGSEREEDVRPAYYDRTYDLNKIERVWFIAEPFKDLHIAAHTFVSFEFSDGNFLSISIEARKKKGQVYNLFKGLLRTYPLMYIAADERDTILMRANVRQSDVFVYPVKASPKEARALFVLMMERMNALATHPRWYHTLWANCTSSIASHIQKLWPGRLGWFPWQLWMTGYADTLAFNAGLIDTDLSLEEARKKFNVSARSKKIGDVEGYSDLIRQP